MFSVRRYFFLVLILLLYHCGQSPSKQKGTNFQKVDSLWNQIELTHSAEKEPFKKVIVHYWSAMSFKPADFNYLCSLIENEYEDSREEDWKQSLYLLKSWYAGNHLKNEESEKYLSFITTNNLEIQLSKIQQLAYLKYANSQTDSAIYLYNKGYQIAKDAANKNWMLNYANNLGTVYYDLRELQLAHKYFKEALGYAESLNIKVPMLLNNIITCDLGIEGNKEAFELYEKYKNDFKSELPYEVAIYKINASNILLKKQRLNEAEDIVNSIDINGLGENIEKLVEIQKAYIHIYSNRREEFEKIFKRYKNVIIENPEYELPQFFTIVKNAIGKQISTFSKSELEKIYQSAKSQGKVRLANDAAELLFLITQNTAEHSKWEIVMLKSRLELASSQNSSYQNDLVLNFKLSSLSAENNRIKLQSELTATQNQQFIIVFVGTILILVLMGVILMFYAKKRKVEVEKLRFEISNSRNLHEINRNKRIFADRLINSNQAMIKKINQIIKNIQKTSYSKEPELIQIRKELIALTEIEEGLALEMDQLKASEVLTFYLDRFPCIQELNPTEKTILSYMLNGQKIKEIAALISVSEQHVRNSKTRILKLISTEANQSLSIEELIQMRDDFSMPKV